MTEEVMQGFVKEAWTDNTLQGFSQRYMVLSKIAHQAIENNEETDTETRKKIRRHILILWRNTTRFPKIQKKAMRLLKEFKNYDVERRASEKDAQIQDEHS